MNPTTPKQFLFALTICISCLSAIGCSGGGNGPDAGPGGGAGGGSGGGAGGGSGGGSGGGAAGGAGGGSPDAGTQRSAALVLGQPAFGTHDPACSATDAGPGNAQVMFQPSGIALINGALYVTDLLRVMVWNPKPTVNNAPANYVFGQPSATAPCLQYGGSAGISGQVLYEPRDIASDGTRLAILDGFNRVLVWSTIPTTSFTFADIAVAQPDFSSINYSNPCNTTMAGHYIDNPRGLAFAGSKLLVSDQLTDRVLVWNNVPANGGAGPDLVIGQADGATCDNFLTAQDRLSQPGGIWTNGTRLHVADTGNQRVLVWNTFPTSNGQAADLVLGQADFTSLQNSVVGASTMNGPEGVTSDGTHVVVVDTGNNRVLIWKTWPTANGQAADIVLGQPDFTRGNDGTDAKSFTRPSHAVIDGQNLWISEFPVGGGRVTMYQNVFAP